MMLFFWINGNADWADFRRILYTAQQILSNF
uniref:Uncharacterized protein n=2 Tax=Neisseria meningitidis TaxID=487 RepID=I4E5Z9_NEIME|nr:hypothetical protein predicted by Glimmer/Critica [Neisseria meningitidis alpha153]CCA44765.1 hypothetical protein NMALPHA522_1224 [Neisseria meningitidis alpha522]